MSDDTSTAQDVQEAEAEEASPVVTDESTATESEAVTEPSETSTEEEATEEEATPTEPDDKLRKYAANQGIELDSPSAIKAAQLAMKHQAAASRNYQKNSELEKATAAISDEDATATAEATGQDPEYLKRLQRVETREAVRDFWSQPDVDPAHEPAMIELLKTKPYLAGDLEALYATAVLKSGGVASVKSQGKREALTDLAHKQQAAVPTGNATTQSAPKKKDFSSLSISEMEKQLGTFRQ
jgi:hypothetical protein